MAYFSTWAHENRVFKTRFINLIKLKEEPKRTQREKKKKKKTQKQREKNPGRATRHARPRPGHAVHGDPGRPIQVLLSFCFWFFFLSLGSSLICSGQVASPIWSEFFLPFICLLCFWIFFKKNLCILTCMRDLRV